jgi:hypothetical protein
MENSMTATIHQLPKKDINKEAIMQKLSGYCSELIEAYDGVELAYNAISKLEQEASFKEHMYNEALFELIRLEGGIADIEIHVLGLSTAVKVDVVVGEEDTYLHSIEVDGITYAKKIEGDWVEDESP